MTKLKRVFTLMRWTGKHASVVGSYATKIEAENHIPFWDSFFHDYSISIDLIPIDADLANLQKTIDGWNKEGK